MRVRVRPTALGVKGALFYAMILVAYLAAPYTNLFFLLLSFLSVLIILGLLWSAFNLRGCTADVQQVRPAPAEAGHEVRVLLDPGGRPRFQVVCQLLVAGKWRTVAETAFARETREVTGRLDGLPRGVHPIEGARILSSYPFGVVEHLRPAQAPADVVSYPAPADRSPWADPSSMAEALRGQAAPVGVEPVPVGLRPWRPGDSVRDVSWKATARRRQPVVVERGGEVLEGLQVCLDRRCAAHVLEESLGLLTTLLLLSQERKETAIVRSQGLAETYGPHHRPVTEALRWLAEARVLPPDAPPPPPVPPTAVRLPAPRRTEVVRA